MTNLYAYRRFIELGGKFLEFGSDDAVTLTIPVQLFNELKPHFGTFDLIELAIETGFYESGEWQESTP